MTHDESLRRSAGEITQVWVGAVLKSQLLALIWNGARPCLFISAGRKTDERQMSGIGSVEVWFTRSPFLTLFVPTLSLIRDPLSGNGCGSPNHEQS